MHKNSHLRKKISSRSVKLFDSERLYQMHMNMVKYFMKGVLWECTCGRKMFRPYTLIISC